MLSHVLTSRSLAALLALTIAAPAFIPRQLTAQGSLPGAAAPRRIYSMRDALGASIDDIIEDLRTLESVELVESPTLTTRAQAMAAARDIAARRSTPALRAFLDTAKLSEAKLRRMAVLASWRGGDGAMALLLAAERTRPGDWSTQYNIAVFLQLEGYPRASLAIIDSLKAPADARGPGGADLRASLLLARGNALIDLGRPREAIPLLREARERDPFLVEAARALARALLLLDDEDEARRVLRAFGRRFADRRQMDEVGQPPPISDPTIEIDNKVLVEALEQRDGASLSLAERWGLDKGKPLAFSAPRLPQGVDQVLPFIRQVTAIQTASFADAMAADAQIPAAIIAAFQQDAQSWALPDLRTLMHGDAVKQWLGMPEQVCDDVYSVAQNPAALAAENMRMADVKFALERLEDEELAARVRTMRRQWVSLCSKLTFQFSKTRIKELVEQTNRCPQAPDDVNRRCTCQVKRSVGTEWLQGVNSEFSPYLDAVEQWYTVAHHHATAVSSHAEPSDESLKHLLLLQLQRYKALTAYNVHWAMGAAYATIPGQCDPATDFGGSDKAANKSDVYNCGPLDGIGLKLDVGIAELKVSCYDFELELSEPIPVLPIVAGVGSMTWTYAGKDKGNLTFFLGVGHEIGSKFAKGDDGSLIDGSTMSEEGGAGGLLPISTKTVKAGGYITFRDGDITDAGFKASYENTYYGFISKETSWTLNASDIAQVAGGTATYVSDSFLAWRGG